MTQDHRAAVAAALAQAYETRSPIDPPSESAAMDLDDAYAVQSLQVERWVSQGATVRGHKVGLTSRAMQTMLGVDQPDYGHLLDTMFVASGEHLTPARFLQARAEPEIAFVLGHDLEGPGVTLVDVVRATDFVVAALEIIDSRVRDWRITLVDTIADNASSGAVVLASRPVLPGALDLRLAGCNLYRNGALVATGAGGAVLGDPVRAVAWLANTLGARGVTLHAGDVVLPGSCTAACLLCPGDTVEADFAGLGPVSVSLAREPGAAGPGAAEPGTDGPGADGPGAAEPGAGVAEQEQEEEQL
jgi:2-keto-4-pentenoate hydratase